MKDYIKIGPDVLYLNFKVGTIEGVKLVVSRRGGGCSKTIDPFEVNGSNAKFIVEEPGFGLPHGWYDMTIYQNCCPCKSYVAKVMDDCAAEFTGSEEIIFDKDIM